MLPRVRINFENGVIGGVTPMDDGVAAYLAPLSTQVYQSLIAAGATAAEPFRLTAYSQLEPKGIDGTTAAKVDRTVEQFYREAGKGSVLWVLPYDGESDPNSDGRQLAAFLGRASDVGAQSAVVSMLARAGGEVRILMVDTLDGDLSLVPDEINYSSDWDINADAVPALRALAAVLKYTEEKMYAPCIGVVPIYAGQDTNCGKYPTVNAWDGMERVCVVEGREAVMSDGVMQEDVVEAIGLVAGRLASIPVQRSLARVKTGRIANTTYMMLPSSADDGTGYGRAELRGMADLLHEKGYIVPRTFVGKTGYYWSDDVMACAATDDYGTIARRRTIDKAYRIAYKTLVEEIGEEIPVTDAGRPAAAILKAIETKVESAIVNQMTSIGNLGTDPTDANDLGVRCTIDPEQNIVETSTLEMVLKVKPYGYAKYIDVTLGFLVEN